MNLVIVESPSKSKTIKQYLGKDYNVLSSKGHIRDLSTKGVERLGLDKDLHPIYEIIPEKVDLIKELNEAVKNSSTIYLATDPDREGEAISWHLKEVLNIKDKEVKRIEFNEITKEAISNALLNARDVNMNLVESQETRRVIDRIIGFKLSKLLQSKVRSQSAGRVQSVALKLIVDKEKEIKAFVPQKYYEIFATFGSFKAKLIKYKNETNITSNELALEILNSLNEYFEVTSIEEKERYKESEPPFITSTLQQVASSKLNMTSTRTMRAAQELYEGVDLGNETVGLITYMRTDSTRLSNGFVYSLRNYIIDNYGEDYLGYVKTKNNSKIVQDAHEAIRPTYLKYTPESVKEHLTRDQYNIYNLIYQRTVASMMKRAIFNQKIVMFKNGDSLFKLTTEKPNFDGYLKVYNKFEEEKVETSKLAKYMQGELVKAEKIEKEEKYTEAPSRYTEARLIKSMEELGIGRPSTYAQTIAILKQRKYVEVEKKHFIPTEQGFITIEALDKHFNQIINVEYTARMENMLDDIAMGNNHESDIVPKFYDSFSKMISRASATMEKLPDKETGETCPLCGAKMVYKKGRFGPFESCSNYPKCKYIKKEQKSESIEQTEHKCPNCSTGHLVIRTASKGKNKGNKFFACSNYPKCKTVLSEIVLNETCQTCGKPYVLLPDGTKNCACKDTN